MGTPYIGEVRLVAFNYPPSGWAFCLGQILPISQNQVLYTVLGTSFGGDGKTTFALPNLQGRTPLHRGNGLDFGQAGGEYAHTLTQSEMPIHSHAPVANAGIADQGLPVGNFWSASGSYGSVPTGAMNPAAIAPAGGNSPHDNMSPYLVLNFMISMMGIYPSQD